MIPAAAWDSALNSAIAAMVTQGESAIKKVVAVAEGRTPIPPCGRCREFMNQVDEQNINAEVIVGRNKSVKLKDLLFHDMPTTVRHRAR